MDGWEGPLTAGRGRSSPERGGVPPKVEEGHGRSRVTYKGQETPRVPLHHASHGPPPPGGGGTAAPHPKADVRLPKPKASATILYVEKRPHFSSRITGARLFTRFGVDREVGRASGRERGGRDG